MKVALDSWINILKSGRKFYKTADLMKTSDLGYVACRAAISRLVKKGFLIHVGKEIFGNLLVNFSIEEAACQAYLPSYLSCEYVLSRHGVIDQMPLVITAVTLKRGRKGKIGKSDVVYKHLRKNLFWGFVEEDEAFIAESEKALLDWIYLNSPKDISEINLEQLDSERLKKYALRFPRDVQEKLRDQIFFKSSL